VIDFHALRAIASFRFIQDINLKSPIEIRYCQVAKFIVASLPAKFVKELRLFEAQAHSALFLIAAGTI
jgi:hypothetical protein